MSEFLFGHNTGAAGEESQGYPEAGFLSVSGDGDISFPWVETGQDLVASDLADDGKTEPSSSGESCQYLNAATCPDCGSGMVRLGSCFSCQACGWGSCG